MVLQNSYILNHNISFLKSIRALQALDISNTDLRSYTNSFTNYEELLDHPTWENGVAYIEKGLHYREEYNLKYRGRGYNDEYLRDPIISESSSESDFSEDSSSSNVIPDGYYEEECWDDEIVKSHPEVTASDDEWQGYIPTQHQQKSNQDYHLSIEHLLEDLYEDAD
ncbi:hypothetical protein Trydic_g7201 [Trypoxylus dichotomus]